MTELILILVIGAGLLYWQAAARAKELAVFGARKECKLCGVQLLDETVQQIKVSMSRDERDNWRFWREYRFEYSEDGQNRFEGRLTLLGGRVIRIALETFNPTIIH